MVDNDNLKRHPNWKRFGKLMRQFYKALGLRQTDVARIIGYSNGMVSKLERGEYPHHSIDATAHRLGILFVRTGVIRSARQMCDWLELIFTVVTRQDVEEMIDAAREQRVVDDIDPVIAGTTLEIIDSFANTLRDTFPTGESASTTTNHESAEGVSATPMATEVAYEIAEDSVPNQSTSIVTTQEPTEIVFTGLKDAIGASDIAADTVFAVSISTIGTPESAEVVSARPVVASSTAEATGSKESTSIMAAHEPNIVVAAGSAAMENVLPAAEAPPSAELPVEFAADQTYMSPPSVVELATNLDSSSNAFRTPNPEDINLISAESVEELPILDTVPLLSEHMDSDQSELAKTDVSGAPKPGKSTWRAARSLKKFPIPNADPFINEHMDLANLQTTTNTGPISTKQQTTVSPLLIPFNGFTIELKEPFVDLCKRIVREYLQDALASVLRRIIFGSHIGLNPWKLCVSLVRFCGSNNAVNLLYKLLDTRSPFLPLFTAVNLSERENGICYSEWQRPMIYRRQLIKLVYSCAKQLSLIDQVELYERLASNLVNDSDEMVDAVHKLGEIGDFSAITSLERIFRHSQHKKVAEFAKGVLDDLSTPAAAELAAYKLKLACKSPGEREQLNSCRAARAIFHDGKRIRGQTYTLLVDAFYHVIDDPNIDIGTKFIAALALDRHDIVRQLCQRQLEMPMVG